MLVRASLCLLLLLLLCLRGGLAQFLTKEEYEKRRAADEAGPVKLNPLQELEDEVRLEGYSIYKAAASVVDARDEATGLTKLMVYALRGEQDECKHQLVQGADPELTNKLKETPLLMAISKGNYHSAVELLRAHANMHHRNNVGLNALHVAIAAAQPVLVEALLRYDDSWRNGVWAAQYHQPPLADTQLPNSLTPLMMCSQDNEAGMLRMLLEHGAAVNVRSDTGEAALMYAAITGNVDIVKILLRFGADPRLQNDFGFDSVMMAANRGHAAVVSRFLLAAHDDPWAGVLEGTDRVGRTALDHAIDADYPEVARMLMGGGARMGKLRMAFGKEELHRRKETLAEQAQWMADHPRTGARETDADADAKTMAEKEKEKDEEEQDETKAGVSAEGAQEIETETDAMILTEEETEEDGFDGEEEQEQEL